MGSHRVHREMTLVHEGAVSSSFILARLTDRIELEFTDSLIHYDVAHYIKKPFPCEKQDAQELCYSEKFIP